METIWCPEQKNSVAWYIYKITVSLIKIYLS